jgi:hypothetical protein
MQFNGNQFFLEVDLFYASCFNESLKFLKDI